MHDIKINDKEIWKELSNIKTNKELSNMEEVIKLLLKNSDIER